ncbi:hypothetical protein QV07_08365 [Gallibacterium genomosp. 3]|uniref:Uncharacterized protein n=2 Tax=Gallibacterium genomosp. 3 TaxID=505345 RepID=A0A1A7PZI4_9PAST|nr:hypothetical protein QV07_08365 [Gallibacterium genomosp. 3]
MGADQNLPGTRSDSSGAIAIGAYNSIIGNSGLAVGSLNRVYGNGGIVVGSTSIADGYSSVGRMGVTMGFNVKAGEYSQQTVAIGANLQTVGKGNIILGGGQDKFYGSPIWNGADSLGDVVNEKGTYTTLGNVYNTYKSVDAGMRFWGDRNIILGAKKRTEGFSTDFSRGYNGSGGGNGSYLRITDNAVTGANNSIRDLSFRNSVYGSNNIVTAGVDNMIIGSGNTVQAAYRSNTIVYTENKEQKTYNIIPGEGAPTGIVPISDTYSSDTEDETTKTWALQTIGNLWRVGVTDKGDNIKANPDQLLYGDSNSIIGARNTLQYLTQETLWQARIIRYIPIRCRTLWQARKITPVWI